MRLLNFLVCFLIFQWPCAANAQAPRNLAYEDEFVWYLSGRLARELSEFQVRASIKLNARERAEHRDQLEIVYHYYLVECGGPLPKIAETLRFFDLSADSQGKGLNALSYVGRMDYEIWPIVQDWNSKILVQLMNTYASGNYSFLPECVVRGFRDQNPIPAAGSK